MIPPMAINVQTLVPQWLRDCIFFVNERHDKLTGYTKGVVCQLLYNYIKPLRRSDSTAAFLFLKGSLK